MKAITFTDGRLEQKEIELGLLSSQWARIRVAKAGLCGTDVAKISSRNLPPSHTNILGHEFIGQVVDISGQGTNISLGDWIVGMPVLNCGKCYACTHRQENLCVEAQAIGRTTPGAFAEFVDVPVANVVKIPDPSDPDAYVLTDTLAVCVHAEKLDTSTVTDRRCLVIGDGIIGSLLAWLLHQRGHDTWIKGIHQENLHFMEGMGVSTLITEVPTGYFDVVYETVGRSQQGTLDESLRAVRWGGQVIVVGVFTPGYTYPLIVRELFIREVLLQGSNAYVPEEFSKAVALIGTHQSVLAAFISHRFPMSKFEDALETARRKSGRTMKIVLEMGGLSL